MNYMSINCETVLAVVVLFNKKIEDVPCINQLISWMTMGQTRIADLSLISCLVYDNSPTDKNHKNCVDDKYFNYVHDPLNGGTRAAYLSALKFAQVHGCKWILLLDHDTNLPIDFFQAADKALTRSVDVNSVCAVVPFIFDGATQVSPTLISKFGRGSPLSEYERYEDKCSAFTAISSAALVRVNAFAAVLPIPTVFSLDFLDHWLFRAMQSNGGKIAISSARVAHSLSIMSMNTIDIKRYQSILSAEFSFLRSAKSEYLPLVHALRLFLRSFRLVLTTMRLDLASACIKMAFSIIFTKNN